MNYTALTIGPIHKTLQSVKSTKAIWAASYMFSYLMKDIIKRIKTEDSGIKFILPYSNKVNIKGEDKNPLDDSFKTGTGLFPDRIIIKGKIALQKIIDDVFDDFAAKSKIPVDYLKNYINCYYLSVELNETENVIIKVNELLDSLELQQRVLMDDKDYFKTFFEDVYYNFLVEHEFGGDDKRFPSTIEIAKAEYKNVDPKKYRHLVNILFEDKKKKDIDSIDTQRQFIDAIKKERLFEPTIRNYQKYIAVVQADGDNMGSFIKHLYKLKDKDELIKRFSKNLLSFAIEAVGLIKNYGGTPIYAGGDDLLFFAPVAITSGDGNKLTVNKTILTLISGIDNIFDNYFTNHNNEGIDFASIIRNADKKPSMSYGVSISYYKFPLNEALEEGVKQLFNKAKKTEKKNAVSYAILKHSRQFFGTTFNKDSASYKTFTTLIKENYDKDDFIKSIMHKLGLQKEVLKSIGKQDKVNRETMFDNFFENNYNESVHTTKVSGKKELIPFLQTTKQLFKDVYDENIISGSEEEMEKQNEDNLMKIYSALRFIEFINNKEERDE